LIPVCIAPEFKSEFYKKSNLISGDENSKHKVAIFSDPLCPFCKKFVPQAMEYMKKYPKEFALYYYHLPLATLHPAADNEFQPLQDNVCIERAALT
jgi:protein-disulfide isomerase